MVKRVLSPFLWLTAGTALAAIGCDSNSSSNGTTDAVKVPRIATLSNRADLVSGGDALVEIILPDGAKADQLHVTLGSTDVTSSFAVRANGRIIGLVTGLAEGPNVLSADLGTGHGSYLRITNHKIGGPVFSGEQVKPFVCATPAGSAESGNTPRTNPSGLSSPATDDQCNMSTEARLFYRTSGACNPATNSDPVPFTAPADACFKPYPGSAPSDLAMTTTDTGKTVPFIVRVERGTLNRGIYDIAVLFDPSKDWKPYAPQAGWNGKVSYVFGASSGQPRLQFHSEVSWADFATTSPTALGAGFLVAVNSQTDSLYNDNRVLMTETLMMMKEKIIDSYGEVRYVIGNGCSGGSINQLTAASIFPGLLDGIQPTCTYPDSETTGIEVSDCALLVNFYDSQVWKDLMGNKPQKDINDKKAAINGHRDQTGCHAWFDSFVPVGLPGVYHAQSVGRANDTTGAIQTATGTRNNCGLPVSMVYDPNTNPTGVRCTVVDHGVALYGKVTSRLPGTMIDITHARTTTDNVGVQYGLKAFLSKAISDEEFVVLNEKIGGVDFDDNLTSKLTGDVAFSRSQGDPVAIATAYRAGLVSDAHHLAKVPIMDLRGYDDSRLNGAFGIHHEWRSFALRARLDAANGNHTNHVMWRFEPSLGPPGTLGLQSFTMIDQWLGAMKADATAMALEDKIVAHRPAASFDFCNMPSASDPAKIVQVTDSAICDTDPLLKPASSPRQVAGGPLVENILKCQLKPIDRNDYAPIGLSDDQFARLSVVFKTGVCDFTKPGVGQQPAQSPLDFSAGSGGVPLPDPPENKAF